MLPKTRQPSDIRSKVTVRLCRAVAFVFLFKNQLASNKEQKAKNKKQRTKGKEFTFAQATADRQNAKNTKFSSLCVFVTCSLLFAYFSTITPVVHAQSSSTDNFGIQQVGQNINIPASPNSDIRVLIVRILNVVLGFLGLVAVCIVLYAGYLWMTSGGNDETVEAAKKMLINGVVGLVIILSAFAITSFILRSLLAAINGAGGSGNSNQPVVQTYSFSGSLGRVVKDHYPKRNQHDVPRNTSIVVTFGVPVNPASIIENNNRTCWNATLSGPTTMCKTVSGADVTPTTILSDIANPYYGDCTDLNLNKIIETKTDECDQVKTKSTIIDLKSKFVSSTNDLGLPAAALTTYDKDRNAFTFVFKPHEYLGSATENLEYQVNLTDDLIRSDTGEKVFKDQVPPGYQWNFTTGNILDVTPPTVVDVYPKNNSTVPRNSIIQITFSEAIDPTTVEGMVTDGSGFVSTVLNRKPSTDRLSVPGSWRLSNGYKTLEFVSSEACGTNSCGEQMFCLPVTCTTETCSNPYEALLRTAEWTKNNDAPFEAVPFSGVYDLAFNGLDNISDSAISAGLVKPNSNIKLILEDAEKAPDNYWWNFEVSNTIDRSAPYVEEILPGVDAENISGDAPMYIQFSKQMMSGSLQGRGSSTGVSLEEYPSGVGVCVGLPQNQQGSDMCKGVLPDIAFWLDSKVTPENKTRVTIGHREFGPNNLDLYYIPSVPSTVKSVTQNCVYPGLGPAPAMVPPGIDIPSKCTPTLNSDGTIIPGSDCVGVTFDPKTDTGCAFGPASFNNMLGTTQECLDVLHAQSPSFYLR